MKHVGRVEHEFVEFVPAELADATLYISIAYSTCAHLCLCGCGQKVVTPLSPTDWALIFDGETISLDPSIGSWSLDCQSHYWIERGRVIWSGAWSQERIEANRWRARRAKQRHYSAVDEGFERHEEARAEQQAAASGWLRRLLRRMRG